jgi:hypothetical protein
VARSGRAGASGSEKVSWTRATEERSSCTHLYALLMSCRAIKRIFLPPLNSPVFFSDVILADILTSFAKVLGDLWVSTCQIWNGGITEGRVAQTGLSNWITLSMVWYVHRISYPSHPSA